MSDAASEALETQGGFRTELRGEMSIKVRPNLMRIAMWTHYTTSSYMYMYNVWPFVCISEAVDKLFITVLVCLLDCLKLV